MGYWCYSSLALVTLQSASAGSVIVVSAAVAAGPLSFEVTESTAVVVTSAPKSTGTVPTNFVPSLHLPSQPQPQPPSRVPHRLPL